MFLSRRRCSPAQQCPAMTIVWFLFFKFFFIIIIVNIIFNLYDKEQANGKRREERNMGKRFNSLVDDLKWTRHTTKLILRRIISIICAWAPEPSMMFTFNFFMISSPSSAPLNVNFFSPSYFHNFIKCLLNLRFKSSQNSTERFYRGNLEH